MNKSPERINNEQEQLEKVIGVYMSEYENDHMDKGIIKVRLTEHMEKYESNHFILKMVSRYNVEKNRRESR